jgi:hypothetical protein
MWGCRCRAWSQCAASQPLFLLTHLLLTTHRGCYVMRCLPSFYPKPLSCCPWTLWKWLRLKYCPIAYTMHPMGPGQKYCRVKGTIWDTDSVYSVLVLFSVREQATSQLQSNSTRLSSVLYHNRPLHWIWCCWRSQRQPATVFSHPCSQQGQITVTHI